MSQSQDFSPLDDSAPSAIIAASPAAVGLPLLAGLRGSAADTNRLAAEPTERTRVDEPQQPRVPDETARARGRRRTLNSRRIAALPVLGHLLRRLRLREFLRW